MVAKDFVLLDVHVPELRKDYAADAAAAAGAAPTAASCRRLKSSCCSNIESKIDELF